MPLLAARMKRVDMVLLTRDVRAATTALGRLGVLEFLEVKPEESAAAVRHVDRSEELERCRTQLARLDALAEKLGLTSLPLGMEDSSESLDETEAEIAAIERRVNPLVQERMKLASEAEEIQDDLARLSALRMFPAPLAQVADAPFLYFAVGAMKAEDLERLRGAVRPDVILLDEPLDEHRRRVVAVTVRRGRFALEAELKRHAFAREELSEAPKGRPDEVTAAHEKRLEEIRSQQEKITRQLQAVEQSSAATLARLYRRLRLDVALIEAALHFGYTTNTTVISGWLPADKVARVSEALLRATEGRVILQARDADSLGVHEESIPTELKNPAWLRPFEVLVTGFGVPRYREIEPTALMAFSFLLLYGVMFGDIGHGLLLVLVAAVARSRTTGAVRDIMTVTLYAGIAATFGGLLYGGFLGFEPEWMPRLLKPMESTMTLLAVPILFGILLISMGGILNVINKLRAGHYLHAIVDRYGLLGLGFYWGALAFAALAALKRTPPTWVILTVLIAPLVILFFRDLAARAIGHGHTEGYGAALINGVVEVMETLTTYLANTFSFARVGAFALAHAGLSMATFALMALVAGGSVHHPGWNVWSVLIFLAGTALIVLLEGLIVFVQCLRLEYYEFFGKFFEGTGRRYKPFRIA